MACHAIASISSGGPSSKSSYPRQSVCWQLMQIAALWVSALGSRSRVMWLIDLLALLTFRQHFGVVDSLVAIKLAKWTRNNYHGNAQSQPKTTTNPPRTQRQQTPASTATSTSTSTAPPASKPPQSLAAIEYSTPVRQRQSVDLRRL
uniref:HDC09508 n=1 Tax=Drosophila melanogaster TaxID=7227 RepID=Q6ILF2_DROME|nr:TPA_inf: HDC09508 [Drosophila melanogaster]